MDTRLAFLRGQRPSGLRRNELSSLSWALVSVVRGHGSVGVARRGGVTVVVVRDRRGRQYLVLKSDWLKIWPLIENDSFNTAKFPVSVPISASSDETGETSDDRTDGPLQQRIYDLLFPLFTEQYPNTE